MMKKPWTLTSMPILPSLLLASRLHRFIKLANTTALKVLRSFWAIMWVTKRLAIHFQAFSLEFQVAAIVQLVLQRRHL